MMKKVLLELLESELMFQRYLTHANATRALCRGMGMSWKQAGWSSL